MNKVDYNKRVKDVYQIVAKNVTRIRRIRGMTKTGLIKATGISRSTLDSLEERAEPKHFTTLIKIADALNVGLDELFKESKPDIDISVKIDSVLDQLIADEGYFIKLLDRYFERKIKELSKKK